ncbi:unnamed protein product [Effrenium voratum]|uniref:Uncharacterized protein n=1 Tax=Effrenium voratum TaxID=2562239 RepID=A0AA36IY84_9DINO|nr:unnamed protein product [Effrenium voratum]
MRREGELRTKIQEAVTQMERFKTKKLLVYYGGHDQALSEMQTVIRDRGFVLEDEIMRAVELRGLQHVCIIVILDTCRDEAYGRFESEEVPGPDETNLYVFVNFCKYGETLPDSGLVPAALIYLMQAQAKCSVPDFPNRLDTLLHHLTVGRLKMELTELRGVHALHDMFPLECLQKELPWERENVKVLEEAHVIALRKSFCLWGCLDLLVDQEVSFIVDEAGEQPEEADFNENFYGDLQCKIEQLRRIGKTFHDR